MMALYCTTAGQPDRPAILFLHGFLGNHREFDPIVAQLQHRFYCLQLDLPGHGQSHWAGDYTMAQTAAAILQLLDEHQVQQPHLVGYSLGGRLALYLALQWPQRFGKTVLESASPGLQHQAERQARIERDDTLANQLEQDLGKFLTDWYEQPLFAGFKQQAQFAAIVQQRSRHQPRELAKALRQLSTGRQPNLWPLLASHPHPLLLLVGAADSKFVTLNQAMAALNPGFQLAIVPDSGHVVHIEQPDCFARSLLEFLV